MTPVRLEPAAPRSRVKHSTTEPLRSHRSVYRLVSRQVLLLHVKNCNDFFLFLMAIYNCSCLQRGFMIHQPIDYSRGTKVRKMLTLAPEKYTAGSCMVA